MTKIRRKTPHRSLVFGDFDRDGVPNIDDRHPFDKRRKGQVEETSLATELKIIKKKAIGHVGVTKSIVAKLKKRGFHIKYRIKGPYSIINKLRRKHLGKVRDFGGVAILTDNERGIYDIVKYLMKTYRVVEIEDFYKNPHPSGPGYRAIHMLVIKNGKYIEVQIKTKKQFEQDQLTHAAYKLGKL